MTSKPNSTVLLDMYVRPHITSHFEVLWFLHPLASFYGLGIYVYRNLSGTVM